MAVEMIGADRDDVQSTKFKSYKGKEGQTDRLGIVFPDEAYNNGKKIYCGAMIHYEPKSKRFRLEEYFFC